MTSEKRAHANFLRRCDSGDIDAYVNSQLTSGRLNNAHRAEMAATGMGMGSLRSTGGSLHSTGAITDSGHKSMRSTGGSSGFGGASLLAAASMGRSSPRSVIGGGSPALDASYDVYGYDDDAPLAGRSQSRHELIMAISQMERRLGEERMELTRLKGEVGRHATALRNSRPRRVPLNMYHASTGAC